MTELEFCKVCGSLKPEDGQCDVCYNKAGEQLKAKYEWVKKVQKSGGPKKNLDSE